MFDGRTDIARYTEIGTLEQWSKEVADPAAGNSRLMFSELVGFAGPLADLLDEGSFGFHLDGGASIGKTAALGVSVAGGDCRAPPRSAARPRRPSGARAPAIPGSAAGAAAAFRRLPGFQ